MLVRATLFGTGRQDSQDEPADFEVRGHDVDVSLVDGEKNGQTHLLQTV